MCRQFRFDTKSQFRVFLAKPQKAADLKLHSPTTHSLRDACRSSRKTMKSSRASRQSTRSICSPRLERSVASWSLFFRIVILKCRRKLSRSYETSITLQEPSDQEKQGIIQVDIIDSCQELLGITGTSLRTILRKRPKLKRAGPDDHLQTLIVY